MTCHVQQLRGPPDPAGEPHGVWGGEILNRGTMTVRKRPRGQPPNIPSRTRYIR